VADRQLVRAIAYVVRAGVPEEQAFFDALIKLGIETKEREVQSSWAAPRRPTGTSAWSSTPSASPRSST